MRGQSRKLGLTAAPLTRFASLRSQIDLSPHAGRGILKPVLARGAGRKPLKKRVEAAE
jgi:hypothetical protein